jgi:hypothetical protein
MTDLAAIASYGSSVFAPEDELTDEERAVLAADLERLSRLGAGAHLDDWLAFGQGHISIIRKQAMRRATTAAPKGTRYNAEYKRLMEHYGFSNLDQDMRIALGHVAWLYEKPERLETLKRIREAMTPGQRARLNAPITARQRVTKALRPPTNGAARPRRATVRERLAETEAKLAAAEAKIAELTDGTLFAEFDLRRSTAAEIGTAIAGNISKRKFESVVKAAKERYSDAAAERRRR